MYDQHFDSLLFMNQLSDRKLKYARLSLPLSHYSSLFLCVASHPSGLTGMTPHSGEGLGQQRLTIIYNGKISTAPQYTVCYTISTFRRESEALTVEAGAAMQTIIFHTHSCISSEMCLDSEPGGRDLILSNLGI